MKTKTKPILSFLLYANLEKEEFKKLYPEIKSQIFDDNKKCINIYSIIAFVMFFGIFLVSYLNVAFSAFKPLYAAMFVFTLIIWLINRYIDSKRIGVIRLEMYFFMAIVFIFAIILSTVYSRDELATTFIVLMIVAPLICVDRPIYFSTIIIISYALFMIAAVMYKNPKSLPIDIANATIFGIFSVIACFFTMNVKFEKYFLENEIRLASRTDVLTGLKNRNAFEQEILSFDKDFSDDVFFVYIDANNLHKINNRHGHKIGDEMLKIIADTFKNEFDDTELFRIGGDEFVAVGKGKTSEEIDAKLEKISYVIEKTGFSIAIGYEFGANATDWNDIMRIAEEKMYEDKHAYYANNDSPR